MIYLIAQMIVPIAFAGILGAAIGWLVHRATHVRSLDDASHALARAQNQAAQIESEVAMLSDDYDELQRRSKTEVNALRLQNQEIPELSSNLEKSQLLVKQLMQKHESRVRDLNTDNATLASKLKSIIDREQEYGKVKLELDNIREQKIVDETSIIEITATDSREVDNAVVDAPDDEQLEPLDATVVSGPADDFINKLNEATRLPSSDVRASGSWASVSLAIDADARIEQDDEKPAIDETPGVDSIPYVDVIADVDNISDADVTPDVDDVNEDPFDSVMEVEDQLQRELDDDDDSNPLLDGSSDNASLFEFEPVEHRDDLKQIFGIGPVTEKALNDLGITSYSQLAELESHQIEKIAGALEIVPGRIERDDWVGNARRQLEDVLEEL